MIYVQIASYRDPQLTYTISDLLIKADKPEELRICIAYQHGEEEQLGEFEFHPQVDVIYIPYQESKGCCWARAQVNERYNGEEYTLQLDSHHRFKEGWDTICKEMIEELDNAILTTYLPSYNPESDYRIENPWIMDLDPHNSGDIPMFRPAYSDHTTPKTTYFFSGHFAFARGQWIVDVPYDRELYFHGEEITMALRSWIKGYNLYHPHKVVAWHEYTRQGRTKQWDDNKEWWKADLSSKERVRKILSGEIHIDGPRTLEEYKTLAGI